MNTDPSLSFFLPLDEQRTRPRFLSSVRNHFTITGWDIVDSMFTVQKDPRYLRFDRSFSRSFTSIVFSIDVLVFHGIHTKIHVDFQQMKGDRKALDGNDAAIEGTLVSPSSMILRTSFFTISLVDPAQMSSMRT